MKLKDVPKDRLLFLDALRILGIAFILLQHLQGTYLLPPWVSNISIDLLPYLFYINYGRIGVWIFVFASGCSLALNDRKLSSLSEIREFYKKRLVRIYPAYWVGVLFSLLIFNWVIPSLTPLDIVRWFSGFQMFFATTSIEITKINITYWFIGLIVSLYLLYPLLFYAMKKHPNISLISFFFISMASRVIMYYIFPIFGSGWDWFPACRFFNFTLGIYLMQKGWFPKANSNRIIAFLGIMSFYVFLVHFPIMCATNYQGIGILFFIPETAVFSFMLFTFDNAVRKKLLPHRVHEQQSKY